MSQVVTFVNLIVVHCQEMMEKTCWIQPKKNHGKLNFLMDLTMNIGGFQ
jgi:hypothetical protein